MIAYLSRKRSAGMLCLSLLMGIALLVSACGGSGDSTGSTTTATVTPSVKAPTTLIQPNTLIVGTDPSYPPQEFADTANPGSYTGFDIDLITEIAKRIGLKVQFEKANFDTILDDLSAKRYDVVISAVTINDQRKEKADFVPYFNVGSSLIVEKGNPQNIKSVDDLCGKPVGVQTGTVQQDELTAASKKCQDAGKQAITITSLSQQTDVVQLLANKRVVATYQDSPVTDYYISQNGSQFEIGGSVVNTAPEGIAVRKGNSEVLTAIEEGFKAVKSDGTYDKLFEKWKLNPGQKLALMDRKPVVA